VMSTIFVLGETFSRLIPASTPPIPGITKPISAMWGLKLAARLAEAGRLKGKTLGVDATTLEVNAALRSIARRETGEGYQEFRNC
jgi:hypothetical protein